MNLRNFFLHPNASCLLFDDDDLFQMLMVLPLWTVYTLVNPADVVSLLSGRSDGSEGNKTRLLLLLPPEPFT